MTTHQLKFGYVLLTNGNVSEIRDAVHGNYLAYAGSYAKCVVEAKRRGIWIEA